MYMVNFKNGVVVESVDTTDSKSVAARRAGSIPANPTILYRGVAQSGSASGLGPEGRRFESCLPDHFAES